MPEPLQKIRDYLQANSVGGWLTPREGALLYTLAKQCPTDKAIVEIGSWQGKSTIYLSNGSLSGNKAHVFAIDPHTGPDSGKNVWTYDTFIKNITGGGAVHLITPIVKFSADAATDFDTPVGCIFIDGDHSYGAVKIDFEKWYPKVVDGGVIAFHDSIKYDGPRRLQSEILLHSNHFKDAGIVDSIVFATKTSQNNALDRLRNHYIMGLRWLIEYGTHIDHKLKLPKGVKAVYKKLTSYMQGRSI